MATLLVKSLGIAGGIAGISATGGGIYYLTSSNPATQEDTSNKKSEGVTSPSDLPKVTPKDKSIASLLKDKKLLTENDEDSGKGAAPGDLFKKTYPTEAPKDPGKFENGTQENQEPARLDSFKTQCVSLGKQKVSGIEDPVFVEVEKYCTTATTRDTGNA